VSPELTPKHRHNHFFNSIKENIMSIKTKFQKAAAFVTVAALPVLAFAEDNGMVEAAKTELGSLKSGIIAVGAVAVALAVAAVSISVIKSAVKRSA
jgi:identified by metaGeneAnnotator